MNIFLVLCERQLKVLGIPEENWVTYLISALPSDIAKLIAREPEEKAQDYQHIKTMLLKRFKLTAEKFKTLFFQHKKVPESTWKDFFFEIRTYFEGWLSELNISSFEDLKNLMLTDKLKRKCSQQHKEHFLDEWADLNEPYEFVEKLDAYDALRVNPVKTKEVENQRGKKNWSKPKETFASSSSNQTFQNKSFPQKKTTQSDSGKANPLPYLDNRPPLKCYGCGAPGFIRAKCPTCNPAIKGETTDFDQIQIYSCSTTTAPLTTVNLYVNGVYGKACIDTGSSHSLASASLYSSLRKHGVKFQPASLNMSLANGQQSKENCLTTTVTVEIQGRRIYTNFIVLTNAKGNRTLLGRDFLDQSGFVPDVRNKRWYFSDMPHIKYRFADPVPKPLEFSADDRVLNSFSLRANEGKDLTLTKKPQLNQLLKRYETTFQPGGDAPSCEINTVSVEMPKRYLKRSPMTIREEQLRDDDLRKIIETFESHETEQTDAFLQFGREPRTLDDVRHDIRPVINNDNFVPEITPYLKNFANFTKQVKDLVEQRQDRRKRYADKRRREGPQYSPGDQVWVELHPVSKAGQKRTTKFSPRRDGPYVVLTQRSPTSYEVASLQAPEVPLGTYHVSALKHCNNANEQPIVPLRKRGRPKKPDAGPLPRRLRNQRGRM